MEILNFVTCVLRHRPVRRVSQRVLGQHFRGLHLGQASLFPRRAGRILEKGRRGPEGFLQCPLPTWPGATQCCSNWHSLSTESLPWLHFPKRGKTSLNHKHLGTHSQTFSRISQLTHRLGHKCQQQAHPPIHQQYDSSSFPQGHHLPCENALPFKMLGGRAGRRGGSSTYPPSTLSTTGGCTGRPRGSVGQILPPPPRGLEEGVEGPGFPGGHLHQGE